MPLTRVTSQGQGRTLEFFYEFLLTTPHEKTGQAMLDFLPSLRRALGERVAWGLTSHFSLWLLNSDDHCSEWLIQIETNGHGQWWIRYKATPGHDQDPGLMVEEATNQKMIERTTNQMSEALDLVRVAIERSGGW